MSLRDISLTKIGKQELLDGPAPTMFGCCLRAAARAEQLRLNGVLEYDDWQRLWCFHHFTTKRVVADDNGFRTMTKVREWCGDGDNKKYELGKR